MHSEIFPELISDVFSTFCTRSLKPVQMMLQSNSMSWDGYGICCSCTDREVGEHYVQLRCHKTIYQ